MAIEFDTRLKTKENFWPTVFLVVCIVLVLVFLISFFYLKISSKQMSEDLEEKKQALIKTSSEKALEEEALLYEHRIDSFGRLLSKHDKPLNVFLFLEEVCHPSVKFSDFQFDSIGGKVSLDGQANDFTAIGQQLLILKERTELKKINLSGISTDEEGKVTFSLQLSFDPKVFK